MHIHSYNTEEKVSKLPGIALSKAQTQRKQSKELLGQPHRENLETLRLFPG